MRYFGILLALLAVSVPAMAQGQPLETGIYISVYGMDSASWAMSPKNPQYRAYKNTDFNAILSRFKADGFDRVYLLPGDWMGPKVMWKTDLPFLRTKEEWTKARRDMMEELLTAADRNHQKVYLCLLGLEQDAKWWNQVFPGNKWFDDKRRFTNSFLEEAEKVEIPAMKEIVRKYGRHPSLAGFGTDEVIFHGSYFADGWPAAMIGPDAAALYKKAFYSDPPSLEPFPKEWSGQLDMLLGFREEVLVRYHKRLADACKALGKEYTTTLNSSMLTKFRWEGLGGERAAAGSNVWRIGKLDSLSEVATDFYACRLSTHQQADIIKYITSPAYFKPINMVLGTQFGPDILANHLMLSVAEGVDRITYWTNYYYYGDSTEKKNMWAPADPDRISYLVKAAKEFRKRVPVNPQYDVAVLLSRAWQRDHYRTSDPHESEIAQMNAVVDALNMAGYRYDILSEEEASYTRLPGYPAVVVPLGAGLSGKALMAIQDYVAQGGVLITFGDFGHKTPWGAPIPKPLADNLPERGTVIHEANLPTDWDRNLLPEILGKHGVKPASPLIADQDNITMPDADYDTYWGPKPRFPVNGKAYDLFWSGDRYQAISIGYRSKGDGKIYRIGRCAAKLKPYQNMIAGKSSAKAKDYDLFLINSKQSVEIKAPKVMVFGANGQWTAKAGKGSVVVQGPVLVRIP